MVPMLIWWFIMARIAKLGISKLNTTDIYRSRIQWSRDPWRKPEFVTIQKNLLLYWKITTKVMISIFQNSTIRTISWSWTSGILVSHSKKAIRLLKSSVVDIFNSDGVSLAELDFTACFQGTCKKFDLYEFDQSHKEWIHGRSRPVWLDSRASNFSVQVVRRSLKRINSHSISTLWHIRVAIDMIRMSVFMMLFTILKPERYILINLLSWDNE